MLCTTTDQRQSTNATQKTAFGRLIQVYSPMSEIVLQILACLGTHLDVDLVFSTLLNWGSGGSNPYLGIDLEKRKGFTFSFKFYSLLPKEEATYPGQASGPFHDQMPEFDIRSSSSSVTLAFTDNYNCLQNGVSRTAPWRVLTISFQVRPLSTIPNFSNGVEAYLWSINNELAVARRSLRNVCEKIAGIAVVSVCHKH